MVAIKESKVTKTYYEQFSFLGNIMTDIIILKQTQYNKNAGNWHSEKCERRKKMTTKLKAQNSKLHMNCENRKSLYIGDKIQ